jgi:hypothetical protein
MIRADGCGKKRGRRTAVISASRCPRGFRRIDHRRIPSAGCRPMSGGVRRWCPGIGCANLSRVRTRRCQSCRCWAEAEWDADQYAGCLRSRSRTGLSKDRSWVLGSTAIPACRPDGEVRYSDCLRSRSRTALSGDMNPAPSRNRAARPRSGNSGARPRAAPSRDLRERRTQAAAPLWLSALSHTRLRRTPAVPQAPRSSPQENVFAQSWKPPKGPQGSDFAPRREPAATAWFSASGSTRA